MREMQMQGENQKFARIAALIFIPFGVAQLYKQNIF